MYSESTDGCRKVKAHIVRKEILKEECIVCATNVGGFNVVGEMRSKL